MIETFGANQIIIFLLIMALTAIVQVFLLDFLALEEE